MNTEHIAANTVERLALWEMYGGFWSHTRWIVYALGAVALVIFSVGILNRIKAYRLGRSAPEALQGTGARLTELLLHGVAQIRLAKEAVPGFFHLTVFWGFAALFVGTVLTFIDEDFYRIVTGGKFITGGFYVGMSFVLDLLGLLAVIGIIIATLRRYIGKPSRIDSRPDDGALLIWILVVLVTGFLAEGARIGVVLQYKPDAGFETWSFAGYGLAKLFGASPAMHKLMWSIHILVSFAFIAVLPSSKGMHIFAALASIFTRTQGPKAKIPAIPLMVERMEAGEDVELGYKRISDLTWREILQTDACTRCGRCQEVCPAAGTGKQLSPMTFIQNVKTHWLDEASNRSGGNTDPEKRDRFLLETEAVASGEGAKGAVATQVLWDCTNCMACMEVCPVFVEHVPLIVQMRRELAMEFDDSEKSCKDFFKNMDVNANPWGMNPSKRAEWAIEDGIPTVLDNPDYEYLFWIGCMGGFDPRSIEIARAFVKILQAAKVNFAILGELEMCCGDSMRRLGNEASFQAIVAMFKEMVKECDIDPSFAGKKVLTTCPHGYNTLKHDYPEFGFKWEVLHHTEFIAELIAKGRLELASGNGQRAVLHDSCFLSRYNGIIAEPRTVLSAAGQHIVEPTRYGNKTFCCGGGGGRSWLEEDYDLKKGVNRINYNRADELIACDAENIVTACPLCMMMLDDATKRDSCADAMDGKRLLDIAEVVAERLVSPDASSS